MPDTSTGSKYQDALPCLDVRHLDQRQVGGQADQGEGRSTAVVQDIRGLHQLSRRRYDVVGVGARLGGEPRHAEHAVARCEGVDARPDRVDRAGHVPSQRERRFTQQGEGTGADGDVDGVDAGGTDSDPDLARSGGGGRHLDGFEHLGAAGGVLGHDAHRCSCRLTGWTCPVNIGATRNYS